jgi:hypothetical protein
LTASAVEAQGPIVGKAVKPAIDAKRLGSKLAFSALVTKFCVAAPPSFL